jgi:hypothetical protein
MDNQIYNEPSDTNAEAGAVIIDGPDGVAVSMTPRAAAETGKRLQASAAKAHKQREGKRPPFDPLRPTGPALRGH